MSTVTVGAITYQRRGNGHWFQACGVEMPRRDWRWLEEIDRLREALAQIAECAGGDPWASLAQAQRALDGTS